MLFSQLRYFEIAQDIYYIKQNPDLSYFELSYVFGEHNDSVGRGTTVSITLLPSCSTTPIVIGFVQAINLEWCCCYGETVVNHFEVISVAMC